jgi:hypothetical protein
MHIANQKWNNRTVAFKNEAIFVTYIDCTFSCPLLLKRSSLVVGSLGLGSTSLAQMETYINPQLRSPPTEVILPYKQRYNARNYHVAYVSWRA